MTTIIAIIIAIHTIIISVTTNIAIVIIISMHILIIALTTILSIIIAIDTIIIAIQYSKERKWNCYILY